MVGVSSQPEISGFIFSTNMYFIKVQKPATIYKYRVKCSQTPKRVVQIFIQLCAGQKSWTSCEHSFIRFYFHRVLAWLGLLRCTAQHTDVDRNVLRPKHESGPKCVYTESFLKTRSPILALLISSLKMTVLCSGTIKLLSLCWP